MTAPTLREARAIEFVDRMKAEGRWWALDAFALLIEALTSPWGPEGLLDRFESLDIRVQAEAEELIAWIEEHRP